jgi:hypothetical protein
MEGNDITKLRISLDDWELGGFFMRQIKIREAKHLPDGTDKKDKQDTDDEDDCHLRSM